MMCEVAAPFEGELVVYNDPRAVFPVARPDGTMLMKIDPSVRNVFDTSRWPDEYRLRAQFADGEPISTYVAVPKSK